MVFFFMPTVIKCILRYWYNSSSVRILVSPEFKVRVRPSAIGIFWHLDPIIIGTWVRMESGRLWSALGSYPWDLGPTGCQVQWTKLSTGRFNSLDIVQYPLRRQTFIVFISVLDKIKFIIWPVEFFFLAVTIQQVSFLPLSWPDWTISSGLDSVGTHQEQPNVSAFWGTVPVHIANTPQWESSGAHHWCGLCMYACSVNVISQGRPKTATSIILTLTIPNPSKSSTCFCMILEDSG